MPNTESIHPAARCYFLLFVWHFLFYTCKQLIISHDYSICVQLNPKICLSGLDSFDSVVRDYNYLLFATGAARYTYFQLREFSLINWILWKLPSYLSCCMWSLFPVNLMECMYIIPIRIFTLTVGLIMVIRWWVMGLLLRVSTNDAHVSNLVIVVSTVSYL